MAPDAAELYATLLGDITSELKSVPQDKLDVLVSLVNRMEELTAEVEGLDQQLKDRKERLRKVQQNLIPELMIDVIGLSSIDLADGRTVSIGDFVSAHISEEHKPSAYQWLRDNNYDGIIKKELKVSLGKVPQKKVESLVSKIIAAGHADVSVSETVHGQTLKKFVKERLQTEADPGFGGQPLPLEVFGVFNGRQATIK